MTNIPYTQQTLEKDDHEALLSCFDSNSITRGPKVVAFEEAVAKYCDVPFAVAFNSGSTALEATTYAGQIDSTDLIVSSPNTFVGTLSGALKRSKNLHLLDIELETGCADFNELPKPFSDQRLCLFPVHFSGIAKKTLKPQTSSLIIEDACQAFGSRYLSGEKVGSCKESDMTVFSFHPAKTLCMGEGGIVTTRNEHFYKRLLLYRNNGIIKKSTDDPWYYEVVDLTNNLNVTDFQAALGFNQLKKIERFLDQRKVLVQRYRERLRDIDGITLFSSTYDSVSAHNLFVTQLDYPLFGTHRARLMKELREKGLSTQVHFIPLYHHPYFKENFSINGVDFPKMEQYYKQALSFPLFSHLTVEQVDSICEILLNCLGIKGSQAY